MNQFQEEQYYFYRLYSIDLDTCLQTIRLLKRYRRKDVRYCIVRDIVVSYARPFSGNRGDHTHNHQLTKKVVPAAFHLLHEELLRLRCQQFAHTDKTFYKPKAANWSKPGKPWYPMSFRGYDYSLLDAQARSLEKMVVAVERNLRDKIREIEKNF